MGVCVLAVVPVVGVVVVVGATPAMDEEGVEAGVSWISGVSLLGRSRTATSAPSPTVAVASRSSLPPSLLTSHAVFPGSALTPLTRVIRPPWSEMSERQ